MANLHLEVVTPMGGKVSGDIAQITAPGTLGDLGVLPGHRPLITSLGIGLLSYTDASNATKYLAVNGGFLQVAEDSVIVVTETAETPDEMDVPRAEDARKRALSKIKELEKADSSEQLRFALDSLARAENRLRVAKLAKKVLPP